jgi:hypothetical protein
MLLAGVLGDPNDITSESITDAQSTAWYNIIGQWENQAAAFQAAYQDLLSQGDFISQQDPQVQADYNALLSKGSSTMSTIQSIQAALTDVKAALAGAWSSITGAWQSVQGAVATYVGTPSTSEDFVTAVAAQPISGWPMLRGLGFLPLIPIAIVAAALAAITLFLTNYSEFNQRMAAYKAAASQPGATPSTLATVAKQLGFGQGSGGLTSSIGTLVWIAAGVAALIFLPRLIGDYRSALK